MTDSREAMTTGKLVVLGGSGFVGAHLVRTFAERGFRVRATSRGGVPPTGSAGLSIESVRCDVRERESVDRAIHDASIVIACFVGDRNTQVQGIGNVLAALPAGARLLYLSTAEVYGNVPGRLDETAPLTRQGWDYADSKLEAELLIQRAAERGAQVALFRPSIVYGPGAETWVVELGNKLVRRQWGTIARFGEGTCNLVYVDDVVAALVRSLETPLEPGASFNLNGPDHITWNEFFSGFNAELGLPPLRRWSVPEALLRAGIGQLPRGASALASRLFKSSAPSAGTKLIIARPDEQLSVPARLLQALKATPRLQALTQVYARRAIYLDDKARKQLGYVPLVDTKTGIARCAEWYRAGRSAS
jgi:nucleoside-diphosphate-sugar epimerase